jgi:hypothetical protein
MPTPAGHARRWSYRCLLAAELIVVGLLVAGGCYSRQNYHVLPPQTGDELLAKCNVVVEGRIVYVRERRLKSWQEVVFFCWPTLEEGPSGPARYDVSIDIEKVLKGNAEMPRRLQVDNCRPLTAEESPYFFGERAGVIPNDVRVRIGFNQRNGNSYRNLIVIPLPEYATTRSQ